MARRPAIVAAFVATLTSLYTLTSLCTPASAQSAWQGGVSTDWFDASNWVASILPGAGTLTTLNTATPNATTIGDNTISGTAATGILRVGNIGTGVLTIENGGKLDSVSGSIGVAGAGTGTVSVTGVNAAGDRSKWISLGKVDVGDKGTGTLSVTNGGRVENIGASIVGQSGTGVGTVFVSGENGIHRSEWLSGGDLTIGESGTGTVTLADKGLLNIELGSGPATLAKNAGSSGTLNIGAAAGQAPVAPGRLSAANLAFGSGTGVLTFNHTDTSRLHHFNPAISGAGTIGVYSGHTTLTGNSSGFSGATNINGGELSVTGTLGGTVNVMSGGTLGGTGAVQGPVTLASGSTLAPGRSIGTLTANSVTFQPGSTYVAEVNRLGKSDRVLALGTATLNGGSVRVDGNFTSGVPYRILDAQGGVNGTFDGVANAFSIFLDPTLIYGTNKVDLFIGRSDVPFRSVATTPNQAAVAVAMDSLAFGDPVYDALTMLDAADAPGAFEALSGEVHASAKSALLEGGQQIVTTVNRRIRRAFGNKATPVAGSSQPSAYTGAGPGPASGADGFGTAATSDAVAAREGFWATGYGSLFRTGSTSNNSAWHSKQYGVMLGLDIVVGDDWRLGVMGGSGRTDFNVDGLASSGSSENYNIGAYVGHRWNRIGLSAGALYGWHGTDTRRIVQFPGLTESLRADYDARSVQVFGEMSYTMQMRDTAIEPFAGLSYTNLDTHAYSESGGGAALSVQSDSTDTAFSTLGVRLATQVDLKAGAAIDVHGMLGWRHAFGDTNPVSVSSLAGSSRFSVEGAPIARDALALELGVESEVTPGISVSAAYQGQLSDKSSIHGLHAGVVMRADLRPTADADNVPKPKGDWQFIAGIPGFLPWTEGTIQAGSAKTDLYLSGWNALEVLRMVFVGEIGAIFREKFTGVVETFYVDIGGSSRSLRGAEVAIGFQEAITEARLGYRPVSTTKGWLEAYAGARFWSVMSEVAITTAGRLLPTTTISGAAGDRWVDPIVGLRGEYNFNKRWYLTGTGDIGGFGVGSDFTWRVQAGGGYRFTENLAVDLQYKAISVDYDNEKSGINSFGFDVVQQGPQVRAVLTF